MFMKVIRYQLLDLSMYSIYIYTYTKSIMEFICSSKKSTPLYGAIIHNNTNVKWIELNNNTTCVNAYKIISELFNVEIKCIENENEKIIPYKGHSKIKLYITPFNISNADFVSIIYYVMFI